MKKDLEWLKEEVEKRIKTIESDDISFVGSEYYDEGYIDGMRDVLYRINQLDEPEVLSQEWIDEHAEHHEYIGYAGVPVGDLQNLLVPKQEEVDRAYRKGFKEGERQTAEYFESITEEPSKEQVWKYLSEHGIKIADKEPETVASVIADFYKSLERLKEVLGTKVKELEEWN